MKRVLFITAMAIAWFALYFPVWFLAFLPFTAPLARVSWLALTAPIVFVGLLVSTSYLARRWFISRTSAKLNTPKACSGLPQRALGTTDLDVLKLQQHDTSVSIQK